MLCKITIQDRCWIQSLPHSNSNCINAMTLFRSIILVKSKNNNNKLLNISIFVSNWVFGMFFKSLDRGLPIKSAKHTLSIFLTLPPYSKNVTLRDNFLNFIPK